MFKIWKWNGKFNEKKWKYFGNFVSDASKNIYQKYKIANIKTLVAYSTSNGEVERSNSTLIEIIQCLSEQNNSSSTEGNFNAVKAYNETIHSVTGEKPIKIKENPTGYTNISNKIPNNQKTDQKYTLKYITTYWKIYTVTKKCQKQINYWRQKEWTAVRTVHFKNEQS